MCKNALRDSSRLSFRALFVLLLFVTLLLPSSLLAQTASTAALTGTVTDPTGAVIANATVTATNTGNGQTRTAKTGSDGVYKITLLPPGSYRVRFEAAGFQVAEVSSVQLNVTETPVLNRSLTVGAQTQEVTVQAETETIQTATSALGTVVGSQTMTDLPLSTRNYTNLIAMTAGANANVNNANALGKGGMYTFVNGSNSEQNNYQMDGALVDNWFSFNTGNEMGSYAPIPVPNPDAIQEFKIQTSTYDAGYGRNPGANVNVVTKSGANTFHGTGFEFFRNSFLNANEWFNKRAQLGNTLNGAPAPLPNKPPTLNQNQYGGTFGGPVIKDKLFFFVSYQETSQKNGITTYGFQTPVLPPIPSGNRGTCTTPNWTTLAQCDAATASFVTALATAISPNCAANSAYSKFDTSALGSGPTIVQVACPTQPLAVLPNGQNNTVTGPAGLYNINPVAINLLQQKLANGNFHIPGSTTGPYRVNTFSDPAIYNEHQGLGNFDYTINNKNTLSGRYLYSTDPTRAPFSCGIGGQSGSCLPGDPISFQYTNHAASLKLTSIVTNNFVNEARVSFQRFVSLSDNLTPFTDSQSGITPLTRAVNNLSQIIVNGGFQVGGNYTFGLNIVEQQFEWADQISWTHGKHSFRAGVEVEHDGFSIILPGADIGQPNFNSFPDFLIGRCGAVSGCALPNGATSSNITSPGSSTQVRAYNGLLEQKYLAHAINAFVQDDFKVNSRLTLNLGLRWEWASEAKEALGGWSGVWPTLIKAQPIPGTGCAVNGVIFGAGASGTGCSLVGFEVPSNFQGPIPAGVYKSNQPYITQGGFPSDNFAPRMGFAWQPLATNRLVVRGGGGYFYDRPNGALTTINGASDPPFAIVPATSPLATLASPFVIPPALPGPSGTPGWTPRWVTASGTSSNLAGKVVTQDFTTGLLYEWNLSTQYEFLPTWVWEVGYVGSRGIHQTTGLQSTSFTQTIGSNNPPINIANIADSNNPLSCGYDGTASHCITTNTTQNVNLRVPYLGFSPTFAPKASVGQSKYNSLQTTVRKQFSHGLQVQAAYTWARSFINWYVGNPAATQPGISPYINPYGPNTYYHPQRLVFNYTWALPLGSHDGVLGQVLSGWNFSGVTTIQNGTPLLISDTRSGSIFASAGSGPIVLATLCPGATTAMVPTSGTLTSRVISGQTGGPGYLNKTGVFCAPQTLFNGTGYGGYGLGQITGPGQNNWDMSLSKTFMIKESQSLQFRTEFFNAFNHTQFADPSTNAASGSFGQINGTSVNARLMQFGLKYLF